MKAIQILLFAISLELLLSACGSSVPQTTTSFAESMKGYELYSWHDGSQWNFSVVVGTNREKTLTEIQSTDVALLGIDELKSTLEKISEGQYVTWSSKETLSFPPDDIIKQVEQICKDKGLILNIAK